MDVTSASVLPWSLAFVVSAGIVMALTPLTRGHAFRRGWFERSTQTRRSRRQRRPTHGGLITVLGLLMGSALAGPSHRLVQAVALTSVIAIVSGFRAEKAAVSPWVVRVGRLAAAGVAPAMGIRAELTGAAAPDIVVSTILGLLVIAGLVSIERTDATGPLVASIGATILLLAAVRFDDPVAPVAAALVGATGAMAAATWPPALTRFGTIGPTAVGASLTSAAIELDPELPGGRSLMVSALALAVLVVAAVIPSWDRRLGYRGITPRIALPLVALASLVASDLLARDTTPPGAAVAVALVPLAVLALIGITAPRPRPDGWVPHPVRRALLGTAVVLATLGIGALAAFQLLTARQSMDEGRRFATRGLDVARDGDLESAERLFAKADASFTAAAGKLDNPVVRLGEVLPGIGPNIRSARTLAAVGQDLSSTAVAVAERAGADDLRVVDGRFPIEGARAVSDDLAGALATLRSAGDRLDAASSPLLLGDVRRGSEEVGRRIHDATRSLEVAAEATRLVPALLGADDERRWMVAALTPSEQRGAGGLAGDYAELTAVDGDVELVRTIPAARLNRATDPAIQAQVLPPVYRERYSGFRPEVFWQNLSATPDVPTMGAAIAAAFPEIEGGGPVHGVVVVDPYGIEALLRVTGPVRVPSWPDPITPRNAARILLFEHYDALPEEAIDGFQGDVIEAVVDELTTGELPAPSVLAAELAPAIQAGHLRLWSPERDAQALFRRIGADGGLARPARGDYVHLLTQSSSESKIDWYLRRALRYQATVDPETGELHATATVTVTNTAPTSGVSSYVIGEDPGPTEVGENELQLTILTPHGLVAVTSGGQAVGVRTGEEQDLMAYSVIVELAAGQSQSFTFTFEGEIAPTSGRYELQIGRQPAVVADRLEVEVAGLNGWRPAQPEKAEKTLDRERDRRMVVELRRD